MYLSILKQNIIYSIYYCIMERECLLELIISLIVMKCFSISEHDFKN